MASGRVERTVGGRRLPKGRLEASSDGVFAIAITLLVLKLAAPPAEEGILESMLEDWPAFLDDLISFSFIGCSRLAHTTTTRFLRQANAALMQMNLLLPLLVSWDCCTFR